MFKKGQSGNPGGRPKAIKDLQAVAREHSPKAFARVLSLIDSDDARVSLAAAQEVLNRAWGKPAQAITGADGKDLIPAEAIAPLEMARKIAFVLERGVREAEETPSRLN